jgi:outer membrane protein OmpU
MKKILFASTALVATASVAAAELTWSGSGRFGLVYNEGNTTDTVVDHRFRLTVNRIAETDSGVKFEGRIRWQADDTGGSKDPSTGFDDKQNDNGAGAASVGGAGFAVSTGGFRVDIGNVSDVFDSGDVINWGGNGFGYTGFLDQAANFSGFNKEGFGNSGENQQTIKARYAAGDFTVSASYTLEDNAVPAVLANADYRQIGAGYSFGTHRIGAMYGDSGDDVSQWAIGADGSFGDLGYTVLVADNDAVNADVMVGLSGSYAVSAAGTVTGFVSSGGAAANDTSYGIGYAHSLGGGVSIAAGVGSNTAGNTQADAGVSFSF